MKLLIIDDHRMVNSALSLLLKEKGRVYECVQASSLGEARAFFEAGEEKLRVRTQKITC